MTAPPPIEELAELMTPRTNEFIPWEPTETQAAFLLLEHREALYGGAAGGGKSVALLAAALQYVDVPGYNALLLRRTFPQLTMPGALIDLSRQWLGGTSAYWNGDKKRWFFPSGATLSFGYLDTDNDKYQYQGAGFHFVGFDELTQFQESQYRYLFSRMRKSELLGVPTRMRAASNPGGVGHDWVYQRFFAEKKRSRVFIPAVLEDNPHLDVADYLESLKELTPIEYEQLRKGRWVKAKSGDYFKSESWQYIDASELPAGRRRVRYWDTASADPRKTRAASADPDFNAGVLMSEWNGRYFIEDLEKFRLLTPAKTEDRWKQVALRDGRDVEIWMAQEPGSHSELYLSNLAASTFNGFAFRGDPDGKTGNKILRAKPLSAANHNGLVFIVRGSWNRDFTEEAEAFPTKDVHDDCVDAAAGAHSKLQVPQDDGPVTTSPEAFQPLRDAQI